MSEIRFKSSLSIKEIKENFKNTDLFASITEGLNEALAYEKCKVGAKVFTRKHSLSAGIR